MKSRKKQKPYWEMTTAELGEATKEFDEHFAFQRTKPLTPKMRAMWEKAKAKPDSITNGTPEAHISVTIEKSLLERSVALAKKKRLTRDALIARGLQTLLAAEGL